MIRNVLTTGLVSIVMAVFAVAYTSLTPPENRSPMADATKNGPASEPSGSQDQMSSQQGLMVFREQIRPLLVGTCLKCHGSDMRSGGLDLTRRATALAGGETGEAIIPGKPDESLMIQLVTAGEMPKEASLLLPDQIAALKQWVALGAPYESEPLAYQAGSPAVATAQPDRNSSATASAMNMKMCPCMQMMMGSMSGQGMMGGQANQPANTTTPFSNPRTEDQARQRAEDHLKSLGNPNLKVGEVKETIASWEIQVVTKDHSLVNWLIIDKKSGELRTLY